MFKVGLQNYLLSVLLDHFCVCVNSTCETLEPYCDDYKLNVYNFISFPKYLLACHLNL
jgi:hypothetical protein